VKRFRKVTNLRLNPFKEEIDNNMKGKFKLLGHLGVALFLVSALMLAFMPAAPVQAATAVTDVWVEFAASSENATADTGHDNIYYVHFKPTTALSRGVDTVTVTWPDGSEAMGGDGTTDYAFTIDDDTGTTDATLCLSDGEMWFSTDYGTTVDTTAASPSWTQCTHNATSAGYRTKITTPIDIAAGQDVWVKIDSEADDTTLGIETPADGYEGTSFKVKVATSQDITPVLSSTFALGDSGEVCGALSASVITSIAGAAAQYTFSITATNAVSANTGKVTIKFPVGTTVPSSISAINIQFSTNAGTDYSTCAEDPYVDSDRRLITAVTPVDLEADAHNRMKILSAAGVTNPTIAAPTDNTYRAMVRTTADDQWFLGTNYAITEGSSSKVAIADGEIGLGSTYPYSDSATMINMLTGYIYVYIADQYGNTVDTSSSSVTVTPSTSSTSGTFYKNASSTPSGGAYSTITSITVDNEDPTDDGQQVYYKDTAAGTYTLTFSATGYTSATWTVTVAPVISLYDANDALVSTYGATSTSPVSELGGTGGDITTQMYGGDYITSAISAAMAGDTVKLGDGIYELDTYITLDKKVTLTSVNGASSTTIRPTVEPLTTPWQSASDIAIVVAVTGTAANPVIIDGLTFTRLRSGTEFDQAVYNNGYNYVTVRNCVFDYIVPTQVSDHEYGSVVQCLVYVAETGGGDAAITSATISNNTFTNCCTFGFTAWGEQGANISVMAKGGTAQTITGATVSGNTLTDCNGIGIWLKGYTVTTETVTASVTDNTLTNVVYPISVGGYTTGCSILRNTITGGYQCGLWVEFDNHDSLVIKNNTFTGCAGTGASSMDYSCVILLYDDGGAGDEVTVQYNDFSNNDATYSIYAKSDIAGGEQHCQYNYYGDATGPYYSALTGATVGKSNPNGTGKQITDLVTYYPWLYKSRADVVADNVSYQTCTMKLVLGGWNTLSTPVQLIEAANAIDELISADDMSIGYYYDAGWQLITTGYTLSPCNAVYIKMKSTASTAYLQFKFDAGAYTTPSKDLKAGWNLISLASLEASKTVANTMASVDLTAAYLPGWSQVVSPSINATQRDIYYAVETAWSESAGEGVPYTLQPGLGYWCYMQNAATLAGFEITPIVPDLD